MKNKKNITMKLLLVGVMLVLLGIALMCMRTIKYQLIYKVLTGLCFFLTIIIAGIIVVCIIKAITNKIKKKRK